MFSAMLGLAHRCEEVFRDSYLAVLWRKDLMHGILWCVEFKKKVTSNICPQDYRGNTLLHYRIRVFK
jgi:hypothetical protein